DTGGLSAIDNQIEEASGTIRLKAEFANNPQTLWPGQFVNVRLLLSRTKDGLVVPASALQQSGEGTFVYIVTETSTAVVRPVTVGLTENGLALIERGLSVGERVVIDGQYLLQPNVRVRPVQPPKR
ncbi:MAG: efflux RND transporter periplasmic adaptor subunit, partial [Desulfobaccales bacterium]